jgi:1,4-dihydroxy-2-naphthoate octaprenyltransferase
MTLYQFARIVETRTKIVSVSAYLIGTLYAVYRTGSLDVATAVVMLLAVLAVDMGTTGFNSFFDYYRGVDSRETNREADKVLVHQGVPPGIALLVSLALFAVAMPLGIALAFLSGWEIIPIGALCMAVGYFYNGGPLPISRTPLGELAAGGFLGSVLVLLSFWVQREALTTEAFLVSLPSLLLVASILTVNNTCDIAGDTKAGRKTLSILLGPGSAPWLIYLFGAAGFLLTAYNALRGILPLWCGYLTAIAAPLVILEYRRMHRRGYSHETKGASMGSISKVFAIYTAVVVLPLLATVVLRLF